MVAKTLTSKEAAYRALKRRKKPMTAKQIWKFIKDKYKTQIFGKTPQYTIGAQIYLDIKHKGNKSRFILVDKGLFGLREYSNKYKTKVRKILESNIKTKGVKLIKSYSRDLPAGILSRLSEDITILLKDQGGIYALYKTVKKDKKRKKELYYIGISTDLKTRIKHHLRDKHSGKWDIFKVFVFGKRVNISELESMLINISNPLGNSVGVEISGSKDITQNIKDALKKKLEIYKELSEKI